MELNNHFTKGNLHAPIGIFDSGLGGLTVLRELARTLPGEDFLYLGDVARLPYGSKSHSVVNRYSHHCAEFLLRRGVKWVVIACNTATAMALDSLSRELPVGVSGVIEPGVRAALSLTKTGQVVVMATRSTIKSEAYLKEFVRQTTVHSSVNVAQVACPLLVPLAEEGWFEHDVTRAVVRTYLDKISVASFDTLLLGCTHYPMLEKSIRAIIPDSVSLVHSGDEMARELSTRLELSGLKRARSAGGKLTFFSTDEVSANLPMLGRLFGRQIEFEVVDL